MDEMFVEVLMGLILSKSGASKCSEGIYYVCCFVLMSLGWVMNVICMLRITDALLIVHDCSFKVTGGCAGFASIRG